MPARMGVHGYLETMHLLPRSRCDQELIQSAEGDSEKFSVAIMLVALGFMYSVHNLIAPNMTAIAKLFHFDNYERDAYIGGELTLFFYFPGVLGAVLAGILSGLMERRLLLSGLAIITSITCLMTARVGTFSELVWARAMTGFAIGGSLPVVYSLVGDWFPARRRATATAYVTAASGAGVFLGQCIATLAGSADWRWPFLVIAFPTAATGIMIWMATEEPIRGGQEDGVETLSLYQQTGVQYNPTFTARQVRLLLRNRTNLLVILQAFPGNIPWGVIIVYIHDFLVQDLGLSTRSALGAIATIAGAAFAGIFTGAYIGEKLYGTHSRHVAVFCGVCNMARALPFYFLFGWQRWFGTVGQGSEIAFFTMLMMGGFVATMASPCTGAMLLNVNLPEHRGSIMATYSVLDDFSKGFGTLFVSMIVRLVGGRAVAYQLSLLLWVVTGAALLYACVTYDEDELQMRRTLDEAAMESIVTHSKQRAQEAIHKRAKAAGEAHFAQNSISRVQRREEHGGLLSWPSMTQGDAGAALYTGVPRSTPAVPSAAASSSGFASTGASRPGLGNSYAATATGSALSGNGAPSGIGAASNANTGGARPGPPRARAPSGHLDREGLRRAAHMAALAAGGSRSR